MDPFKIGDRYEKVFLLRIMKEVREKLAGRLVAIELIEHKSGKTKLMGETATVNKEIDLLNRMIDELWSSILTGPPIPGVVDPTVGTQTTRSGMDGDRPLEPTHPLIELLTDSVAKDPPD